MKLLPGSRLIKRILFLVLSVLVIFLTWAAVRIMLLLSRDTVYEGVYVEGINISGLTKAEALHLINTSMKSQHSDKSIILRYGQESWTLKMEDISLKYLAEKAVEKAYSLGRSGNFINRLEEIRRLKSRHVNIPCSLSYDRRLLRDGIWKIKEKIDREPENATVWYEKGKINRTESSIGLSLDVDATMSIIEEAIKGRKYGEINLVVEEKKPHITTEDVNQIEKVIASFSTHFNPQEINRTYNLKLSAERINNVLLKPGEIFSMNEKLGPRTAENGYREAPIIVKNEVVPGIGGGVCQMVSTLYNAVLLSRLDVVERSNHSVAISYVKPGLDATIAENYLDFKFRNNMDSCILVHAEVIGNKLTVSILGKDTKDGLTVKLRSEVIEVIPPQGEEYVIDEEVLDGIKVILREPKNGYRTVTYRETYDSSGKLIKTEKISEDVYNPIKAQYRVNSRYEEMLEADGL